MKYATGDSARIIAVKLIPIMADLIKAEQDKIVDIPKISFADVLVMQIQFVYMALDIDEESSDFLGKKTKFSPSLYKRFTANLETALRLINVPSEQVNSIIRRVWMLESSYVKY